MADEKKLWQSQTELVMAVGAIASLLSAFGVITLTPEQIGAVAAGLFGLGALTRAWSDGTKLIVKNSQVVQELLDGDTDLPTMEDVKADLQSGAAALTAIQQAAAEAGLTNDQVLKLTKALKK